MRKEGVYITVISVLLLVFLSIYVVSATIGDACFNDSDCDTGETCVDDSCVNESTVSDNSDTTDNTNSTDTTDSTNTNEDEMDRSALEKGFDCLEEEVENNCDDLSVQEMALVILSTPNDDVFDECLDELKDKESNDNWGNTRDTALAILALDHAGEDTSEYEEWLIKQNQTPTDLIWYLQQDSNQETECKISYDGDDYTINVRENKKIDSDAGECLTRAQSSFWLRIAPDCLDETFAISCDKNFIANLIYKNSASSNRYYVLGDTQAEPSLGSIELGVTSKCFPLEKTSSSSCNYEATAWSAIALKKTGHSSAEIEAYIPYLMALAETNERYLPNSFIYMVTGYDDYATRLIQEQDLGYEWEAPSSAYNQFYDTALALLAVGGSSSEKVQEAEKRLLSKFSQDSDGCWNNKNIRDTAIILWALAGRSGRSGSGGGSTTYCSEANYFCIPNADCPSSEQLTNFYCSGGLSVVCCENENLKQCSEYFGEECSSDEVCTGNERRSTDTDECCTGECVPAPESTECDEFGYICRDTCSENQEEISYQCDGSQVCCKSKPADEPSYWWIWLLIILILIVLGVLGWFYRDKLKFYYYQILSKFKKDKGDKNNSSQGSGGPRPPTGPSYPGGPKPGFPPVRRRPPVIGRPIHPSQIRQRAPINNKKDNKKDSGMDDVFKKLKEMAS